MKLAQANYNKNKKGAITLRKSNFVNTVAPCRSLKAVDMRGLTEVVLYGFGLWTRQGEQTTPRGVALVLRSMAQSYGRCGGRQVAWDLQKTVCRTDRTLAHNFVPLPIQFRIALHHPRMSQDHRGVRGVNDKERDGLLVVARRQELDGNCSMGNATDMLAFE